MSALRLRVREGPGDGGSGVFRYPRPEPIEYRWDGAGIDPQGELVVLEEESGPINSLHVYGHLARLQMMTVLGDPAVCVAWIVREDRVEGLRRIVRPWYRMAPAFSRVAVPRPLFISTEGEIL